MCIPMHSYNLQRVNWDNVPDDKENVRFIFKVDYLGNDSFKWDSDPRNGFSRLRVTVSSISATKERRTKKPKDMSDANFFKVDSLG